MKPNGYGNHPCYAELVAIIVAAVLHVIAESGLSESIARLYNAGISVVFVGYLVWRFRRTPRVLQIWGIRCDNFWPALGAQLGFVVAGGLGLVSLGMVSGSLTLPAIFWLMLALYPVWGLAQQFAFQNLIARNLVGAFSNPVAIAVAAAALFGISHYPRLELVLLTLVSGIFFTLMYRRRPNLWAVGIAHGLPGSLAVYIVVKEDPGGAILNYALGP